MVDRLCSYEGVIIGTLERRFHVLKVGRFYLLFYEIIKLLGNIDIFHTLSFLLFVEQIVSHVQITVLVFVTVVLITIDSLAFVIFQEFEDSSIFSESSLDKIFHQFDH